jgi:hypothetical protein
MKGSVPPRIYGIPATMAPIVAVFRRGPTNWSHVGRWDFGEKRYEPGAWLGGRIFPRRSDLSPDGRFLCYFAHKPSATWKHGEAYVALSKLPWLTALHASPRVALGRVATTSAKAKTARTLRRRNSRSPTDCAPFLWFNLRTNGAAAGRKRRTLPNATPATHGMSVATPASRNGSPAATGYFVWKASDGLEASSASIRR